MPSLHSASEKSMNKLCTPVNISRLSNSLKKHPNLCFVNYLITGLIPGFVAVLCFLQKVTYVCNNLQSALKEPEMLDKLLTKEVERGFMIRPYDDPPFSTFCISPLGIATRKYSGKKHLIVDLSAPHDDSVPNIYSLIPLAPSLCFILPWIALSSLLS